MIIGCPNCFSRFRVPDHALTPSGRKLRCGKCAHEWKVDANGEPLDRPAAPAAGPGLPATGRSARAAPRLAAPSRYTERS
ncbi:MAG: zinc-ribbon domain-containing protein, partial [Alphaproteobacteria bacterium]